MASFYISKNCFIVTLCSIFARNAHLNSCRDQYNRINFYKLSMFLLKSDGIKDLGYLLYYYKSIGVSGMKPFLYFYRAKPLDYSPNVKITPLLQKRYEDVTHD